MSADVILIVGCTGAGKTTYARGLADQIGGVRFSIDDWMETLFAADRLEPIQYDWMIERIARCEAQIFALARQLAQLNVAVVLDLGFTKKVHRDKFRLLADDAGLTTEVHFIDVPAGTRWDRVKHRNEERGETYAMQVTREMFDFMENLWEPPEEAEWSEGAGRRIAF